MRQHSQHWSLRRLLEADSGQELLVANNCGEAVIQAAGASGGQEDVAVTITAYNGGELRVDSWSLPVVLDLQAGAVDRSQKIPILFEHEQTIGHTDEIEISKSSIKATGAIYIKNDNYHEIIETSKRGFPWRASVGVFVVKQDAIAPGKSVVVNGRTFVGPIQVVREWRWKELSLTKWPADVSTSTRVAAAQSRRVHPMTLEEILAGMGVVDPAAATAAQLEQANRILVLFASQRGDGTNTQPPDGAPPAPAGRQSAPLNAGAAESGNSRAAGTPASDLALDQQIRQTVSDGIAAAAAITTQFSDFPALASQAIAEGWDAGRRDAELRAARASALVASRPSGLNGFNVGTSPGSQPLDEQQVIEAALALSAGVSPETLMRPTSLFANDANLQRTARRHVVPLSEQVLNAADAAYRGIGLQEVCLWSAHRDANYQGRIWGDGTSVLRASFSTLSLPTVFQNTLNRIVLQRYAAQSLTWRRLARASSARDFRTVDKFRVFGTGQWEQVGPDGVLKHGSLAEGPKYTNRLSTVGQLNVLTRQDFINDDLGSLGEIGDMIATYGALAPEFATYLTILANAGNFFSVGNNTLKTTNALTLDGLKAAHGMFRQRREARSKKDERLARTSPAISVAPKLLVVPVELEVTAWDLVNATAFFPSGSTDKQLPDKNFFAGRYEVIATPYLSDEAIHANAEVNHWYLFADPAELPAIDIMFLNGNQVPVIETAEADFNQLGIQFRGYTDFGVTLAEKEAVLRCTA